MAVEMTIYSDDRGLISGGPVNLLGAGHFYIKLEGSGLDQGAFAQYTHTSADGTPEVVLGFYANGLSDDYDRMNAPITNPSITQISTGAIPLNVDQFVSAQNALENFINNTPPYVVTSNNCVDFVNSIYSATHLGTANIFQDNTGVGSAALSSIDTGAARYAALNYLGGEDNGVTLGMVTRFVLGSAVTLAEQATHQSEDLDAANPQLAKYAYSDGSSGQVPPVPTGYFLGNGDTLNLPDHTGVLQAYTDALGSLGGQTDVLDNSLHVFLNGTGLDSADYSSLTGGTGLNIDLLQGTATFSGSADIKDYFNGDIKNVTGSSYNDVIKSGGSGESLNGGAGNDTITAEYGDTITGGSGANTVIVQQAGTGTLEVTDFKPGTDKLDLSTYAGTFLSDLQNNATEANGNTTLNINGQTIQIDGVTKANLFNAANNDFVGVIGGTPGNTLVGNSSANSISTTSPDVNGHYATANNDTLTGGLGNDTLVGGAGNDLYAFNKGDGSDTINETANTTDKNELQVNASNTQVFLNTSGNSLIVTVNDGTPEGSVTIANEFGNNPTVNGYMMTYIAGAASDLTKPLD